MTQESAGEEVFLAARYLEATDYNPNDFGTHIVLGGGPPAVTPPGPGRSRRDGYQWSDSPSGTRGASAAATVTPSPEAGTSPNSTTPAGRSISQPPLPTWSASSRR